MSSNKSAFVGGAISESQYLWMLLIILSYCKKNNINEIIFESKLSPKILNNKIIKKRFEKIKLTYLKKNNYLILIKFFLFDLFDFFKKKKEFWFSCQIKHAFIDTSRILAKKNTDTISFLNFLKASLLIIIQYSFTKNLINNHKLSSIFLGHTVYQFRVSLAILRNLNLNIYCHANNSLYKINKSEDNKWDFINNKQSFEIKKLINKNDVINYWFKRIKGHSTYEDYNTSYKKNYISKSHDKLNVMMLHVFQDSPFNFIDKKKLFIDYYDWFINTINILNVSSEKWFLKIHPSANRWGENSNLVINKILQSSNIKLSNNIIIDKTLSNSYFFENLNKLITFSGTSGIESMAYGIKPITISQLTSQESILTNYYFQPKTLKEYEKLINSNGYDFKIKNNKIIFEARKLIFIKENVITLNTNFNSKYIYRGDSNRFQNKQFKLTEIDIEKNENFLIDIGKKLRLNHNFLSKKYFYLNENATKNK